ALRLAAEAFYRCPAALGQGLLYGLLGAVGNNQPVTGDGADQVMKLPLNRRKVGEDVRMIVFQVVDDQRARTEMHEFGALVEERAVVLIGFDNEERAFAKPGRAAKVDRYAPDQKAGFQAGVLEYPGQYAGRGGLAVGT